MFGLRHEFTYCRCVRCGSLWLQNPPASLSPYYGEGYYSMTADPKGAQPVRGAALWLRLLLRLPVVACDRLAGRRGFPRYISWLARAPGVGLGSRIADVGSGKGALVLQMSRHGFRDVWGFDPFIAGDQDLAGVHLRRGDLAASTQRFRLIMFNHSLEHVGDPVQALRSAAEHLAPDGVVLVRTPVARSWADRHYGSHWVGLDPPRHLAIASEPGMAVAAAATGLVVARTFFDSQPLQFWASEQYARDIPLWDKRSGCEPSELATLAKRARALNAARDGDTAGYVLHHTG
jgi:SAM-dependent methyltransferase